jgi:RNA polymerase sigma-70 factor (ECF subfamily)
MRIEFIGREMGFGNTEITVFSPVSLNGELDREKVAMDNKKTGLDGSAEDELVTRAQQSDNAAFEELMRRTSGSSFKLAMSILRDRQEAEDEVQNSYLNAWRHVKQFQREAKFSTWMSRIVANHCLMRLRKARGAAFVYLDDAGEDRGRRPLEVADNRPTPEGSLSGKELSALMQREIARLPPILRGVLVLRDVEELSTDEAASRLGISASAVKARLLRARVELRSRLENYYSGPGAAALTA